MCVLSPSNEVVLDLRGQCLCYDNGGLQLHQNISVKLTHWGRDKMPAIFQTTFSNAFSWMKICEFRLIFHWILFLKVNLYWFR